MTRVIDVHTHAADMRLLPREFVDGALENMCAAVAAIGVTAGRTRMWDRIAHLVDDEHCDALVREMDDAGIGVSVLQVPDFTVRWPGALTIEEILFAHRAIVARHPGRLVAFAGVDPRWGVDGVALFERALRDWGFRGFKLYPPCGYAADDRSLHPFYELCAAYGVPVLVHVGGTSPGLDFRTSEPLRVDAPARAFPTVPFILGHGGVAFVEQSILLCRFRPNVFLDLSGYHVSLQFPATRRALADVLHAGIGHKILFGTDWPLCRLHGVQRRMLDALVEARGPAGDLAPVERDAILGDTASRLLGMRAAPGVCVA